MKVKVMYYNKRFNNKPDVWETIKIQGYTSKKDGVYHEPLIVPTEIDIKDLATGLSSGATFKPALLTGSKSDDWTQQQLFALDFDHDTTIEEELARCKGLNIIPCFGYTSFSHSEQEHHFRLVFCADEVITDVGKRNKLQETLIAIFSKSDIKTKDATRLFYGGRKLLFCNDDRRINADEIIKEHSDAIIIPLDTKRHGKTTEVHKKDANSNLKIEAIKTRNVEVMQSLLKVHKI